MNIRDFLTTEEVEEIKTRIVQEIVTGTFLGREQDETEDGCPWVYRKLHKEIEAEVKDTARELLHEEVSRIARETIAPQIAAATEKLLARFVKQVDEIANKVNWYWSIK